LGLAIGVGFSTFNYGIKSIGVYRKQLASNDKELLSLNIQKIKEISPQEFQQFTFYLKDNAKIYDDLAFLAKDSLVKAENENYDMTTSVRKNTKFINDKQTEFKINIENVINTSSTLYSTIQKDSLLNLDNDNIELFLKYYHNYKSQIYTRDSNLEKEINDNIYGVKAYNKSFNEKNGVFEKAKELYSKLDNPQEKIISKIIYKKLKPFKGL